MLNRLKSLIGHKKRIGAIIALILPLIIVSILIIRSAYRAEETSPLATAHLSLIVEENGKPGLGMAFVGGECREVSIPSQQGRFDCDLAHANTTDTRPLYQIQSVSYQSFVSNKAYRLPISPLNAQAITVKPGSVIRLKYVISSTGSRELYEFNGSNFVIVDPKIGLRYL